MGFGELDGVRADGWDGMGWDGMGWDGMGGVDKSYTLDCYDY